MEAGIDVKTVQSWLSVLQSSYIIYLLPPYYKNYNKRVVKTPKLYFIDTGVACSLLGIRQTKELENSHFRGALFENYVIMELLKEKFNTASTAGFYYWKENNGLEIDLLIDAGKKIIPAEIKSSATFTESQIKNLQQWNKITGDSGGLLLYNGDAGFIRSDKISVTNWRNAKLKM
jgi:predicted AAA+ superfamily ATPase